MIQLLFLPLLINPPLHGEIERILKHKNEDIFLEYLANFLRVAEEYHKQDETKEKNAFEAKVHVVEEGPITNPQRSV